MPIYKHCEIDAGIFKHVLPEGAKLYMRPELPTVKFKHEKVTYTVTDVRLLNESAVQTFAEMLSCVIADESISDKITLLIPVGVDESTVDIITDIIMGISFSASKGGKNGFYTSGAFLATGYDRSGQKLNVHLIPDNVLAIRDYYNTVKPEKLSLFDLVIAVAKKQNELFDGVST